MIFVLACAAIVLWAIFVEGREAGRLTWREIRGVTRWLLRGPDPIPSCRACGVELPDPMFRVDIGHGAVICETCEGEINLEVGLAYPKWFDRQLPEEGSVTQSPEDVVEAIAALTAKWPVSPDCRVVASLVCPEPRMNVAPAQNHKKCECDWCENLIMPNLPICDYCILHGRWGSDPY